jgi:hypothetical protein
MTIAVGIRTGSAVVFAADSKVTTRGVIGRDGNGDPVWVEQTYDNATKVVHDRDAATMAMIAGAANIGQTSAIDFISTLSMGDFRHRPTITEQDAVLKDLVDQMVKQKTDYWSTTSVPPDEWPGPTIMLAACSAGKLLPRVWRIELSGPAADVTEIMKAPSIRLEGAYRDAFRLLHAWDVEVMQSVCQEIGANYDDAMKAVLSSKVLRPLDKLNLYAMPLQDAIDLAYFLATVQVQMDRFLPGTPACGGPIDVMVLRLAPDPGIHVLPGKMLHHPGEAR